MNYLSETSAVSHLHPFWSCFDDSTSLQYVISVKFANTRAVLLITADVYKCSDELVAELPSLRNGRPVFCSVRGRKRLKTLLRFCESDDSSTTTAISKCRKLTAVRDVWTMFLTDLKNLYKPSAFLTVDELRTKQTSTIHAMRIWYILKHRTLWPEKSTSADSQARMY
ncbi:hypothetical protein T02_7223 [Trichinella nativa]|uniref:PiggyBac transposable element-derived protein domain-containing protein n=1 Tax=Trichinella nativa TaxID=6335 RepID=A0A0V1KSK3_9BILA|nr:hypothetical protein T02_7223 [Trichinella nativa]